MAIDKMPTVLYVDDEEINRFLFEFNFAEKFKVITAGSGKEALEKLRENQEVAAIVSDMRMPGMSGVEFLQKASQEASPRPSFILTGFEFNEEIDQALSRKEIIKVFTKPLNVEEITKSIEASLLLN